MKSAEELKSASQDSLINFLRADLALSSTFADLVGTELSMDKQGALDAFAKAKRGSEIIGHFARCVQDPAQRQDIEQQLNLLESRLSTISELLSAPSPTDELCQ